MNTVLKSALAMAALAMTTHAAAQAVFYEHDGFTGRSFTTEKHVGDFARIGFNDRASSIVVLRDRWEVCEDAGFKGRCVVLRAGRYTSLSALGLNDRVSSARAVVKNARIEDNRYAPAPLPVYDNYRRHNEKVYEANVTSVRAVLGPPDRRCWIEQEHVSHGGRGDNAYGPLAGGVIGYQAGGGRNQDVQKCVDVQTQNRPDHWDVTYDFRGQEHRIQMLAQPGKTITVNGKGEPRA
jgi:hypothetical protein